MFHISLKKSKLLHSAPHLTITESSSVGERENPLKQSLTQVTSKRRFQTAKSGGGLLTAGGRKQNLAQKERKDTL